MKTEVAQRISDDLQEVLAKLDSSVQFALDNCEESEFLAYRRAVAYAMASVVDVTAGLYRRNPELKPAGWDGESNIDSD